MTVLSQPTALDQLTAASRAPGWDCGEETTSSDCRDFHAPGDGTRAADVENYCSAHWSWWSPSQGTWNYMLIAYYLSRGISAGAVSGRIKDYLPVALARGHRCKILVQDNNGEPVMAGSSQYSHWMTAYGMDDTLIYCMNPWGGRLVAYPIATIDWADFKAGGIEIGQIMPKDVNQPPPVNTPGTFVGDEMGICRRPDGSGVDEVVQGTDNVVYHRYAATASALKGVPFENLGGSTRRSPWCIWDDDMSAFHVHCVGTDSKLYGRTYTKSSNSWNNWAPIGGSSPG